MTLMRKLAEERIKGCEEGRENTLLDLVRDGMLSTEYAATMLGKTVDEVKVLVEKRT